MGAEAAAAAFLRAASAPPVPSAPDAAASLLLAMDDTQSDHLKAYGVTYRALKRGVQAEWLLNYRGGSFLLPADDATERDAALAGVAGQEGGGWLFYNCAPGEEQGGGEFRGSPIIRKTKVLTT